MSKVVLAFSGGLDTSYCVKYLAKQGFSEIDAVTVNTGGFSADDLKKIEEGAYRLGVTKHVTLDVTEEFYQKCVRFLIYGNIKRNNTYPLCVSAERMFQALALAEYAHDTKATHIAHGSTGAGNDQVRFDLAFQVLAPEVKILTPIRDQKLSREAEIEFLKAEGVDMNWEKAKYSINQGLWGTSVGGAETLTSHQSLPEEAWPSQLKKSDPETVALTFEKGELKAINGKTMDSVTAIQQLNDMAKLFAIGRDVHVGDTIVGIKGRVGFEAAAPLIIYKAHETLEKHVLSKWQQYWKDQLGNWYGMLLHEAQFLEPVMRNIEAFLTDTQANVTGIVEVKMLPYRFEIIGTKTSFDLMNPSFGSYGEMNLGWSGDDVKGFTKILANNQVIQQKVAELNKK